jgi:hypothetical protein
VAASSAKAHDQSPRADAFGCQRFATGHRVRCTTLLRLYRPSRRTTFQIRHASNGSTK